MTDPVEVLDRYKALLDECRARLSAAEQERDEWKRWFELRQASSAAAAARAEAALQALAKQEGITIARVKALRAAEQALHEIAAADGSNDPTWWGSSPEHLRSIARAALAGREETGGGGEG